VGLVDGLELLPLVRAGHGGQPVGCVSSTVELASRFKVRFSADGRNFLSERIIYQLAPQEALAQYSGADPHQASTVWLDSAFGMGTSTRDVIEGYDCPEDALLLPAVLHEGGSSIRRRAICVFERPSGRPLSRHTGWVKGEMGAVKGFELVVRWVSTVGNYDYIVSAPTPFRKWTSLRDATRSESLPGRCWAGIVHHESSTDRSSTTSSSWTGRSRSEYRPRGTFRVDYGRPNKTRTDIGYREMGWGHCMTISSIVSDMAPC
jgi:hypothetical protein